MNEVFKTCFASVVSELQQSDIYLTVKARLFESPKANLNGAIVTMDFLDEIVENEDKYVGLPLCADIKNLTNGHYQHLGHLYNQKTGEFLSTQIGSFYKYEKEEFNGGAYLVGYARVMKRNKAVCKALAELFAAGALKFSFEISCGSYETLDNGNIKIDAADNNFLEGAAVVTFPACEDAVALELVAEVNSISDDLKEGECVMTDVIESVEVMAEEEQVNEPVVEVAEDNKEVVEEIVAESETSEDVVAETEIAEEENAELRINVHHHECETVNAYDTDTGIETSQTVSVDTYKCGLTVDDVAVASSESETAACGKKEDAECECEDEKEEKEEPMEEDAACGKKKNENAELIESLIASIEELKHEIAKLKSSQKIVAEKIVAEETENEINPFVGSINSSNKYSLLESSKKETNSYSLLEKA